MLSTIKPDTYVKPGRYKNLSNDSKIIGLKTTENILEDSCLSLGISKWRLAYLLDLPTTQMYGWGKRMSMSAFYLARVTKLLNMKHGGVDLASVAYINWQTGEIAYKNDESIHNVLRGKRNLQAGKRGNRKELPHAGSEQAGSDETHNLGTADISGDAASQPRQLPKTKGYRRPSAA